MNPTSSSQPILNQKIYIAYQAFKYLIYGLLTLNLIFFFQENHLAVQHTFANGIPLGQFIEAYSDTIDSGSWVLLLFLFELETYVISDKYLTNKVKLLLLAVRSLAYGFIIYSFYGYISRYLSIMAIAPFSGDICSLIGSGYSYIVGLNDYQPIDQTICTTLQQAELIQLKGTQIIGTHEQYQIINNLALVDVINAGTWLLIVVILEIDVFIQAGEKMDKPFVKVSNALKFILYFTLFACAIYWWIDGDFLDFWDAFLWLVAFVFIEMNIFEWQKEIEAHNLNKST